MRTKHHKILWMEQGLRAPGSYIGGMNLGTWLFTRLKGRRVGTDADWQHLLRGAAAAPQAAGCRRWVAYAGPAEASLVPPEWHSWLHYTTDEPLVERAAPLVGEAASAKRHRYTGELPPPGHDYQGGQRARATGDYEAWTPGS